MTVNPAQLARLSQAMRRGELVHVDEPWLCLPIVAELPATTGGLESPLLNQLFQPEGRSITGALLLGPEAAYREIGGHWEQQPLTTTTGVRVEITAPTPRPYHHPRYESQWQVANRIRVGSWPAHGVWLRLPQEQQRLIGLLLAWYERRVPVQELYQEQRTFLLNPRMSYAEIQAFKQRYGVQLYR